MMLMCDGLSALPPGHLRLCISMPGQFGRQEDTNIALAAAESLFWGVSDAIQAKRREADHEPTYSALWMHLFLEILPLCVDARPEVRMGAIQTLFKTLQLYGGTLSLDTWDECVWKATRSRSRCSTSSRRTYTRRAVSAPALCFLERALKAAAAAVPSTEGLRPSLVEIWGKDVG
jgi:hypothetical protein